ncbi:MAG TPA: hypothetical protein PK593_11535 [Thermomicrobiales bacterium]|nr:hypothetical protein [Chloroflexota bacterium]HQX64078.1 hypothetical protein [Thermomicrobiales bacterium]HBY46133.1 hypothetical protein [Chloroflexota bacterium]HCG28351.1 hypothetical protein [Chloroflexota bacterium]HQZ88941.1 hypothetical protein [Thermomicrobiales bacterium]
MDNTPGQQERLAAALGYVFTPIVPLLMLTGAAKERVFLRRHARQAIFFSPILLLLLVATVIVAIWLLRQSLILFCILPLLLLAPFVPGALIGWAVYSGHDPSLPVIGGLANRQEDDR